MNLKEEYRIYIYNKVKSLYPNCKVFHRLWGNKCYIHIHVLTEEASENMFYSLEETCKILDGNWILEPSEDDMKYYNLVNRNVNIDANIWNRSNQLKELI